MECNAINLTLEFVKKLRERRLPEEVADPSKGIPFSTIRWVVESLEIESSAIYIYLSAGRQALRKKINGNKNIWRSLEEESGSSKKSKLLLKITCRMRGKHHSSDPIGYLGVYKSNGFDELECSALTDIA